MALQCAHARARGEVPKACRLIVGACEDVLLGRRPVAVPHRTRVAAQRTEDLAPRHLEHLHEAIAAARDEEPAVAAEPRRVRGALEPRDGLADLAPLRVVDVHAEAGGDGEVVRGGGVEVDARDRVILLVVHRELKLLPVPTCGEGERACGVGCTRGAERREGESLCRRHCVCRLMGPTRQRRGAKERDELVVLWRQVT